MGHVDLYGRGGTVGVVVIHEVFGRDPYVGDVARSLAEAGYAAATVDLYQGRLAKTLDEAFELRGALTEEGVFDELEGARAALWDRLDTGSRIGTLGFCMGGGYALLGACHRPFDFAVDFYGRIERPEDVAHLRGPVLVLLGSEDERITPWVFAELLPAARAAKKRVSVELFPGVRHAFHRPGWDGYDGPSAAAAWRRTLSFLAELRAAPDSVP